MEHSTTATSRQESIGRSDQASVGTRRYKRYLLLILLLSLPLSNPWVHGDGIGYYAFARSLLIEHRLDFQQDWLHDPEFRQAHTDARGHITLDSYTATGHLDNHFSIGPAILWAPFLIAAHAGVLASDAMGARVPANGYSKPYLVAMALGTVVYGFLGLWISFLIARRYVAERWAFLATIGIWAASSLPVYMYFNPSWSHAQSAFSVALFVWYWDTTRGNRNRFQWVVLGLLAGLMMDVYYVNGVVMVVPFIESLAEYRRLLSAARLRETRSLLVNNVCFACAAIIAFGPTLITKKIIYGSYLNFGYAEHWSWNSPAALKVAFSADHGLLSWTPIIILSLVGLFALLKRHRDLALHSLVVFALYLYAIGAYQDWDGISSFGNRFFVSLTPIFVFGLAGLFDWLDRALNLRRALALAVASTALLILWNFGMMYQWGMHLVPVRGPISWRKAAYNQVAVVPSHLARDMRHYFLRRSNLMEHIEEKDVRELKGHSK